MDLDFRFSAVQCWLGINLFLQSATFDQYYKYKKIYNFSLFSVYPFPAKVRVGKFLVEVWVWVVFIYILNQVDMGSADIGKRIYKIDFLFPKISCFHRKSILSVICHWKLSFRAFLTLVNPSYVNKLLFYNLFLTLVNPSNVNKLLFYNLFP